MITAKQVRASLEAHQRETLPTPDNVKLRASVALILRSGPAEPEICFIKRAARDDDPWSGQMGFPGGRAEVGDQDARAVAVRETNEEIALPLSPEHYVGALSDVSIRPVQAGGVVSPFVFDVGSTAMEPRGNHEVAAIHWLPLKRLWQPEHRTILEYDRGADTLRFPGIAWEGEVIWGLSLRVCEILSEVLEQPMNLEWPDIR